MGLCTLIYLNNDYFDTNIDAFEIYDLLYGKKFIEWSSRINVANLDLDILR